MKTYIFKVEVGQEDDGRWSTEILTLPGCAAWGATKEEAIEALQEGAQAYLDVLFEDGRSLPKEAEETAHRVEAPDVAVTL